MDAALDAGAVSAGVSELLEKVRCAVQHFAQHVLGREWALCHVSVCMHVCVSSFASLVFTLWTLSSVCTYTCICGAGQVVDGEIEYDVALATPDVLREIRSAGRVLRQKMPSVKNGWSACACVRACVRSCLCAEGWEEIQMFFHSPYTSPCRL